jgi:hypothetical protein
MTKRKAISALNKLKEKLLVDDLQFGSSWILQAESYLAMMIGGEDVLTKQFESVASSHKYFNSQNNLTDEMVNGYKLQFTNILQSSIEKIKHTGLIDTGSRNILYRIDDKWLIPIFSLAITGIFGMSSLWGKYLSDTQNIELRMQVKKLQDSLSTVHPCVPSNT